MGSNVAKRPAKVSSPAAISSNGDHRVRRAFPAARSPVCWREAVRSCGGRDTEVRVEDPGGGWSRASLLATPLLDEQGNVSKWSGCIIDADERAVAPSGSI